MSKPYGMEVILDLHECDVSSFNRKSLQLFFDELCDLIEMEQCIVHFWDDVGVADDEKQTLPHTVGTSAVCFILTSSIVVHTLDLLRAVYLNIFSCKPFDPEVAAGFAKDWFKASRIDQTTITRN